MKIPNDVENWTTAQWIAELKRKTGHNLLLGIFLGISLAIGFIAIAFYYAR